MFGVILSLVGLVLHSSPQTATYDIECLWCLNVVINAQSFFGDDIANVTDGQFVEYFDRTCRLDRIKSPLLAAVCYEMFQNHRPVLFNDLRKNATAMQTCLDCGFCENA